MQFAGKTPPPYIIVLLVTFFPLQGFFNLVVYMFPRILRYFEEGVPLTQSFKRTKSSFFTSLKNTVSKRRTPAQAETQVSCDEGNVESGEKGAALEVDVDVGTKKKEKARAEKIRLRKAIPARLMKGMERRMLLMN